MLFTLTFNSQGYSGGYQMRHLKKHASYFIPVIIILGAVALSQSDDVCRLPGFKELFKLRHMWHPKCPYCGLSVTHVSQHELICTICNAHWKRCQETHIHCASPNCKMVVDDLTAHQKTCGLCGITYLGCFGHTCRRPPWDYSRSDRTSEKAPNPKLSPVGTVPRPAIKNTLTDR